MLLITGASGFLGSAVAKMAVAKGMPVRAMMRKNSSRELLAGLPPESIVFGDMLDPVSLRAAVQGADAVVHCAATTSEAAPDLALSRRVNVEGTQALLDACREAGLRRHIQISSQSAHPANPSVYGRTKMESDEKVMAASDIDWTILKPSIIYGPQPKGVFAKMVNTYRKLPVIPIFGSGKEEMRPIHVDDVAAAALACIDEPNTIGRTYDLGGADVLPFNDFVTEILKALAQRKPRLHVPIPLLMLAAQMLSLVMKNPPVTPDNIRGIQTVRHVDISAAQKDFGFAPRAFSDGLVEILQAIRDTGK